MEDKQQFKQRNSIENVYWTHFRNLITVKQFFYKINLLVN